MRCIQKIEQLKTKQGLLLKQVDKTETRYTLTLIDSDSKTKIEKVSQFALVKRTQFIERVKCRQLQDVAQDLMFEAAFFAALKKNKILKNNKALDKDGRRWPLNKHECLRRSQNTD